MRVSDAVGNPKELLHNYEEAFRGLRMDPHQLSWARQHLEKMLQHGVAGHESEYGKASDIARQALYHVLGKDRLWNIGAALFRAILQNFVLPPALRKKAETAARVYYTRSRPTFRKVSGIRADLAYIEAYDKLLKTVATHAQLAHQALSQAQTHSEEGEEATRVRVGPFTLVNAGGFPSSVIKTAATILHKAVELTNKARVGQVCYGEVPITNKIGKSNVAAFYSIQSDELYVRGDLKQNLEAERTVLHELGHRYEHKFLRGGHRAAESLYFSIKHHESLRKIDQIGQRPDIGEVLVSKGRKLTVTKVQLGAGTNLKVFMEDEKGTVYSAPLATYLHLRGTPQQRNTGDPGFRGFVTDYAGKNAGENFAEMFAFYCMGKLPASQRDLFEKTLFG